MGYGTEKKMRNNETEAWNKLKRYIYQKRGRYGTGVRGDMEQVRGGLARGRYEQGSRRMWNR
jgi:hypothetical protein